MIRRISTKWVLTVLAAVVLPFVGFAWYVNVQMSGRMWDVVRHYLLSIAGDLADRVDRELAERRDDVAGWAEDPVTAWALAGDDVLHDVLQDGLERFVERESAFDLVLAVSAAGLPVAVATRRSAPDAFRREVLERVQGRDLLAEPWMQEALRGEGALVDTHASPLVPPKVELPGEHPENYHVGIAEPVRNEAGEVVGVVYGLLSWALFQYELLRVPRPPQGEGTLAGDIYGSSYPWLWKSDCDTILGHRNHELYGQRVSGPLVALPQLVEAARASDWGMYPEYVFGGVRKNAAFKHTRSRAEGGLGWVVGIGIDNADVYATVDELRGVLLRATLAVLGIVVLGTVAIARRTTRPIRELERQTERVAAGDLETEIDVRSKDELGALAAAFNRMTRELRESRARLVKAEKDAAWREMARQVAHEIKNPLTPISLSLDLVRRARNERSPELDAILGRTLELIQRQVESLRRIASDFSAFAGARSPRVESIEVGEVLDEVLELDAAWAAELGVELVRAPGGGRVLVDRHELRRVLMNLVSNALEAMSEGGRLEAGVSSAGSRVRIEVRDSGAGLTEEARARLFEPYFTTRTHGTGLGLAICRRLVEEMGGTIELVPRPAEEGGGTVARVELPRREEGA